MLVVCSNCEAKIRVPEGAAGKKGKCPKCGTIITITPPADAPPPAPEVTEIPPSPEPEGAYAAEVPPPPPPPTGPPPVPRASRRVDDDYDDEPRRRRDEDDEPQRVDDEDDDLSIRRRRPAKSSGMALTGMILGIAGLVVTLLSIVGSIFATGATGGCCCFLLGGYAGFAVSGILGVLGIIFGFIGLGHSGRGFAWTGIVTGGVNLVLILAYVVLSILLGAALFAFLAALAGQAPPPNQPFPPRGRF